MVCALIRVKLDEKWRPKNLGDPPTVAHHVPLIGSVASYIKEDTSFAGVMLIFAGLVPNKHNHWNPGQILPHFYVRHILVALKLRDLPISLMFTDFLNVLICPPGTYIMYYVGQNSLELY